MNLDSYKLLMIGQYEASLRTLHAVLKAVTTEIWVGKLANHGFDQSVFHALFYTDVYLSENEHVVSDQEFHKNHASIFAGYEEFNFDPPTRRYRLDFATRYHAFCLEKVRRVVNDETDESLAAEAGFSWQKISRGELHVYNIRHLQHHVAQFIMRLRLDANVHIDWYKSG